MSDSAKSGRFGLSALAAAGLLFLICVAFVMKLPDMGKTVGARNLEATYHVLLTENALSENPFSAHHFLPIVSLGNPSDKFINWGNTQPTAAGNYIYTSFSPPGFVAPLLWFKATHMPIGVKGLAIFNSLLGAASAAVLYLLLVQMLRRSGVEFRLSLVAGMVGVVISLFSREALASEGIIYWVHDLSQLIIALSLYFLLQYLTAAKGRGAWLWGSLVVLFAFLGAWTEWTGYVYNLGLIAILVFVERRPSGLAIAAGVLVATVAAGAMTVIQLGTEVGYAAAANTLATSFHIRSAAGASPVQPYSLLRGYELSYGIFLVILCCLAFYFALAPRTPSSPAGAASSRFFTILRENRALVIAATVPLLENVLMMQHASQFTFDRLKFVFPAAMIIAFAFASFPPRARAVLAVLVVVAMADGFARYKEDNYRRRAWGPIDAQNQLLVAGIRKVVDLRCAVISANIHVRGYPNLLLHRGIHELEGPADAAKRVSDPQFCASIYLDGSEPYDDLPQFDRAVIMRRGQPDVVLQTKPVALPEPG